MNTFLPHKALFRSLAVIATLTAVTGLFTALPSTDDRDAQAADASGFDAGYIISDANFYDSSSMTASDVQSFLNVYVPSCEAWRDSNPSDITCLKDYWTQTTQKTADAYCNGYNSAWQSAAQIIDGVARSCGISQKVLLVTLQKENALVNHSWPSSWRYKTAMGYGCPDGAACDSQYFGLFNQIYNAARQFKVYAAKPSSYRYVAGQNNYIQWNPNAACGGSTVYIRNQATASLYNYTPYQPNAAAKSAGYGSGDSCSSYGNRNFFLYYSDWFGAPTGYSVHGEIAARYTEIGGLNSSLGKPTAEEQVIRGEIVQQRFEHGVMVWSAKTGAWPIWQATYNKWNAAGGVDSLLGLPTGQEQALKPGTLAQQTFQGGIMIWSDKTGAWPIWQATYNKWNAAGGVDSLLGLPTGQEQALKPGTLAQQTFQGGIMIWSDKTGAWPIWQATYNKWNAAGGINSLLGLPIEVEREIITGKKSEQRFERGRIVWTLENGSQILTN